MDRHPNPIVYLLIETNIIIQTFKKKIQVFSNINLSQQVSLILGGHGHIVLMKMAGTLRGRFVMAVRNGIRFSLTLYGNWFVDIFRYTFSVSLALVLSLSLLGLRSLVENYVIFVFKKKTTTQSAVLIEVMRGSNRKPECLLEKN